MLGLTCLLVLMTAAVPLAGCILPTGSGALTERACLHYDRFFGTQELSAGWSNDGSKVILLARYDPEGRLDRGLFVISPDTQRWKKVLAVSAGFIAPNLCTWNPRDDRVLVDYSVGTGILDVATGDHRILSEPNGEPVQVAIWSPEGDSVWYWRQGEIRVMSANGGPSRPVGLPLFRPIEWWSFSPDGRRMAFAFDARDPDGGGWYRQEIAVINRDGTGYRVLTRLDGNSANPKWIHGGKEILFDSIPITCYGAFPNMERYWFAVDVQSGRIRQLSQLLGSTQFQFSFPIAVDPAGERAVVVGEIRRKGFSTPVGALYVTPIERPRLERLFADSPREFP